VTIIIFCYNSLIWLTWRGGGRAVQLPLKKEGVQEVFVFHAGAYAIYPEDGHKGAPTQDITAEKIGRKVKGLTGYRSLTQIHMYYQGRQWQRSIGTAFGAYSSKARAVKT